MPTRKTQYKNLRVQNNVSVEAVDDGGTWHEAPEERYVILLVGPTGSGKSRFVEALSGSTALGISKDGLQGVTQNVQLYRLKNCQRSTQTVYLVDTPGLIDYDLSEMRVFHMISLWMKERNLKGFDCLLYFDRITVPRMSASRLSGVTMVQKALLRHVSGETHPDFHPLIHVTTMWDTVLASRLDCPKRQFDTLRSSNGPWKEFATLPNRFPMFARFRNTQRSALKIIDGVALYPYRAQPGTAANPSNIPYFPISIPVVMNVFRPKRSTSFGELTYSNLSARIANVEHQVENTVAELTLAEDDEDAELIDALQSQMNGLQVKLTQFQRDRDEFLKPQQSRKRRRSQSAGEGALTGAAQTCAVNPSTRAQHDVRSVRNLVEPATQRKAPRIVVPSSSPVRFHLPELANNGPSITTTNRPPSSATVASYRQSDSGDSSQPSPIENLQNSMVSWQQTLRCIVPSASFVQNIPHSHRSSMYTPTTDSSVEIPDASPSRISTHIMTAMRPDSVIVHRETHPDHPLLLPATTPPHSPSSVLPITNASHITISHEWKQPFHRNTSQTWANKLVGNFKRLISPASWK